MRFCPFCAQENSDEGSECAHCGRRLPVLAANQTSAGVRVLSTPSTLRAPPVRRPLPRPRPVAPARELERPVAQARPIPAPVTPPAPSGPVPTAVSNAATSPEGARTTKTGTLLGIATITDVTGPSVQTRNPYPVDEAATRIEANPFDGATTPQIRDITPVPDVEATRPQARYDSDNNLTGPRFEQAKTDVRRRPAPLADEDPTAVRAEKTHTDDGPTQVGAAPGFASAQTQPPPRPAPRGPAPPMPLPPPPTGAKPVLRHDPPEGPTDVAVKLPGPRPAHPEAQALPIAPDGALPPEVSPMPPVPAPGLLAALRYLPPLAQAVWDRYQAQGRLRALLHEDQRAVDEVLLRLGEAAWKEAARPAELREELGRADEDEARRRGAENEVARLDMSVATERDRFSADEHRRKGEIAAHEAEIVRLGEDLNERQRAKKVEEKALKDVDARCAVVQKRLNALVAKAAKAEVTPPEKGGGPNAAANIRREAEQVKVELDGFTPQRAEAEARVLALDEPIATLTAQLAEERRALEAAKVELAAERAASTALIAELTAERAAQETGRTTAEKNVRLRLVSTGTLLSLHRLFGSDRGVVFDPIYARLDELQAMIAAREQQIARLDQERGSYDRPALQRGLIVVGAAFGVFVILLVTLLVLLGRRH